MDVPHSRIYDEQSEIYRFDGNKNNPRGCVTFDVTRGKSTSREFSPDELQIVIQCNPGR